MTKLKICLVTLSNQDILHQLQIEEALLRTDTRNWCVIHENPKPAVVLGISSKVDEMVDNHLVKQANLPLIRRFSGGGTVVIDHNCFMSTFICNSHEMQVSPLPKEVFNWSHSFYKEVFSSLPFELKENDYVIENKKCGGNAQYMTKNRWLHHTSFLWDYNKEIMNVLKHPPKAPSYRLERSHDDFLCKLSSYHPSKDKIKENFLLALDNTFKIETIANDQLHEILNKPHRKSSFIINKAKDL